ncbi:hypothetical protein KIH41_11720 [Litoribacter ruber]|uniref:DUF975 family protein n=1 Tax=Litoribacter ruber TaxID=702568 RepID=A0AAP2CNA9_9BACT|nr:MULTISPECIES: hypothetical protein [Litoribacter]MBS9524892.1 hypothetical protein [Litoribacter alkaliphilus]MBT0811947.1 hypothetical protein [Litoribacter ruber]
MEKKNIEKLLERGYDFDIRAAFEKAFEMFSQNAINCVAYSMLILSVQLLVATYVPELTLVYSIFLFPALVGGFFLVANKISQGDAIVYPDFFKGFQYYIVLILINLVGQVLVALGIMALIVPGVYLMVGYMFSFLFAIFAGTDFWQSLELSRKVVHKRWGKFFILFLLLLVLNILAALPALLGLLVSLPVSAFVIYNVFETVTEGAYEEEE